MSTKIYNGFYLDVPIEKAVPVLKDIKKALSPMMMQRTKDAMSNRLATLCLDTLKGETENFMPPKDCSNGRMGYLENLFREKRFLEWASWLVEVSAEAAENHTASIVCVEDCCVLGKVVLFPREKKTYGIVYGADDFCQAFLGRPQVHDFYYWNNTDKPDNVSDEEWTARGNIWDELVPGFWAEDDGFVFTLFNAQRFLFPSLTTKDVDAWFKKNRDWLISRRAKALLREKIAESTTQGEMSEVSYALRLDKLARQEIKDKTNLSAWAIGKAAEEIPHDYSGMLQLLN